MSVAVIVIVLENETKVLRSEWNKMCKWCHFKTPKLNLEDLKSRICTFWLQIALFFFLQNHLKAHKTTCSISYLGKLESQFNRLRALYRPELFTDWDQQTCRRVLASWEEEKIKAKCRECIFLLLFCKRYELWGAQIQALCLYLLALLKWNALIKQSNYVNHAQISSYPNSLPLKRASAELRAAAAASLCASAIQTHTHRRGASFIWCSTFLLPSSRVRLLPLVGGGGGCFLGVVFGCVLCSGSGGLSCSVGGFGGLRWFWGSVGRMSPTPPFIPSRGWVTPPSASLFSHGGLWETKVGSQGQRRKKVSQEILNSQFPCVLLLRVF